LASCHADQAVFAEAERLGRYIFSDALFERLYGYPRHEV
jgi:hypothetical protein